jgi:hypothetical protein
MAFKGDLFIMYNAISKSEMTCINLLSFSQSLSQENSLSYFSGKAVQVRARQPTLRLHVLPVQIAKLNKSQGGVERLN